MNRLPEKERELARRLRGMCTVYWFDSVESTMDMALSLASGHSPAAAPLAVLADVQTRGRGRMGRAWHSLPGSLNLSYLTKEYDFTVPYSMVASLALFTVLKRAIRVIWDESRGGEACSLKQDPAADPGSLEQSSPEQGSPDPDSPGGGSPAQGYAPVPLLKWVNDLLWPDKRKIAGILTEERGGATVIGTGVNLNCRTMPSELAERATSLYLETGRQVDLVSFAANLIGELVILLERVNAGGVSAVLGAWEQASGLRNKQVSIRTEDGSVSSGTVRGIDRATGALILSTPEGERVFYEGSLLL